MGKDGIADASWCGTGLLAYVSSDQVVRVNDILDDEDNFVLPLADVPGMEGKQDKLVSLAYQPSRRLLAAGTRDGRLAIWRASKVSGAPEPDTPPAGPWVTLPCIEATDP